MNMRRCAEDEQLQSRKKRAQGSGQWPVAMGGSDGGRGDGECAEQSAEWSGEATELATTRGLEKERRIRTSDKTWHAERNSSLLWAKSVASFAKRRETTEEQGSLATLRWILRASP